MVEQEIGGHAERLTLGNEVTALAETVDTGEFGVCFGHVQGETLHHEAFPVGPR